MLEGENVLMKAVLDKYYYRELVTIIEYYYRELVTIIENGDSDEFKKMLNEDGDIAFMINWSQPTNTKYRSLENFFVSKFDCCLNYAIHKNDIVIMEQLIEDFNFDVKYKKNLAISICSATNNFEMMNFLINDGADVNCTCVVDTCHSILEHVVTKKNNTMAKILLEAGADPNINEGLSLTIACSIDTEIVKLLLLHGANINNANAAINAISLIDTMNRGKDILQLLIDSDIDINMNDGIIFKNAIRTRNINIIRLLLENGADHSVMDRMTLDDNHGSIKNINYIIDSGIDPIFLLKIWSKN